MIPVNQINFKVGLFPNPARNGLYCWGVYCAKSKTVTFPPANEPRISKLFLAIPSESPTPSLSAPLPGRLSQSSRQESEAEKRSASVPVPQSAMSREQAEDYIYKAIYLHKSSQKKSDLIEPLLTPEELKLAKEALTHYSDEPDCPNGLDI
jgi:hypothetical protein